MYIDVTGVLKCSYVIRYELLCLLLYSERRDL
jgi:hypothetical protein